MRSPATLEFAASPRAKADPVGPAEKLVDAAELRTRISQELNRLSDALMATHGSNGTSADSPKHALTATLQQQIGLLGKLAAGLTMFEAEAIPEDSAGYGSRVVGKELNSARRHEYTLMPGPLVDIEAGHVSLASPIGQALLGRRVGDVVAVELPHRWLQLEITELKTVTQLLDSLSAARAPS